MDRAAAITAPSSSLTLPADASASALDQHRACKDDDVAASSSASIPGDSTVAACPKLADDVTGHHQHLSAVVLEVLPYGHLAQHLRAVGTMDIGAVRGYAAELVCAIDALHAAGVVHSDVCSAYYAR